MWPAAGAPEKLLEAQSGFETLCAGAHEAVWACSRVGKGDWDLGSRGLCVRHGTYSSSLPRRLWRRWMSPELTTLFCFPDPAYELPEPAAQGTLLCPASKPRQRCLWSKTGLETAYGASKLQQLEAKQLGNKHICPPLAEQLP